MSGNMFDDTTDLSYLSMSRSEYQVSGAPPFDKARH